MVTSDLETLDRILDELDELASAKTSTPHFCSTLAERLKLSVGATFVTILLPINSDSRSDSQAELEWVSLGSSGVETADTIGDLKSQLAVEHDSALGNSTIAFGNNLCVPVHQSGYSKGCILATFDDAISSELYSGGLGSGTLKADLVEVMAAFAEVLLTKQRADLERFLDEDWSAIRKLCRGIAGGESLAEIGILLTNEVNRLTQAVRTSVAISSRWGGCKIESVSGAPTIDLNNPVARKLQEIATSVLHSGQPFVSRELDQPSTVDTESQGPAFANFIAVPLRRKVLGQGKHPKAPAGRDVVIIEFENQNSLVAASPKVSQIVDAVECVWEQQRNLLGIPRPLRSFFGQSVASIWSGKTFRWCLAIVACLTFGWLSLRPMELRVEAKGVYEPQNEKYVYASADGFVEELFIDSGDEVELNTILLRLRSPELALQIEEAEGELRAIREETNSLKIAINQLTSSSQELAQNQIVMASKIQELKVREDSLIKQLGLLHDLENELTIRSSLPGMIVGKDLRQQILGRPVKRGDALFKVAEMDGPWHLRLQVADKDLAYATGGDATANQISYSFDRQPDNELHAKVYRISDHVENWYGEGTFAQIYAQSEATAGEQRQAGAGVHAYFDCGQFPTWFVWSRPLVEAAQRRFWLKGDSP